jgi:hypothetical protein
MQAELKEFTVGERPKTDSVISRMSWRISSDVLGGPPRGLDFQRHQARNPARCHLMMVSGLRIFTASNTSGAR